MFDVIWTDHKVETVGEHRARKEREAAEKKKLAARSGRNSVSTTSSRSSTDSPFSIFRSRGLKRNNTSSAKVKKAESVSSGIETSSVASSRSPLCSSLDEPVDRSSGTASAAFEPPKGTQHPKRNSSTARSNKETVGSLCTSISNQVFSATPSADVTNASSLEDDPMTESEKINSLIQIFGKSPNNAKRAQEYVSSPRITPSPHQQGEEATNAQGTYNGGPLTPPISPIKIESCSPLRFGLNSPLGVVPPLKSPLGLASSKMQLPVIPNSPDAWKPPDKWEAMPEINECEDLGIEDLVTAISAMEALTNTQKSKGDPLLDVAMMMQAKTTDVLSSLEKLWTSTYNKEMSLLLGETETAVALRKWMLSTFNHLKNDTGPDLSEPSPSLLTSPTTSRMALCLFESATTVDFMAALNPSQQFYHVSTTSRTTQDLPNVRMVPVASAAISEFPVTPRLFESVHSTLLSSLCPSGSLPGILKNVYQCLKIGSAFHVTLIDPLPRAGMLGMRMRCWIERHLLHNLAKQLVCMSPSTIFPDLLGAAGLRGTGSTITTTKFYAVPRCVRSRDFDADVGMEDLQEERRVKAEVRSLVGRMLWVEVWGRYVTADRWWWEEPACVAECTELGTFWEYHLIRGVKGE